MVNPTTGYIVRNGNFPANTDLSNVFQAYTSTLAATTGFKLRTTGQDLNLIFEGLGAGTGTPDPSNTGYKLKTNGYDLVQIFKKIGAKYDWQQTGTGIPYGDNTGSALPSFTTAMSSDGSIQIQLLPYTNSYAYSNDSGNTFKTFLTLNNLVTSCAVSGNGTYGLITTAASGGGTTNIYLSTTLTTNGNFTLLDNNTIVPKGQQYTTCAVSSSGRYMCVFDIFNGYCYSADFGANWSGTTLINTSSSDLWNTRYTVVLDKEGTGADGQQPMVYTSSNDANNPGDLRWYDSFFTATSKVPPTLKGKNAYGNGYANDSGFFSMCLNGNYIYASAGNSKPSKLLLQYNISRDSWSTHPLPATTQLFSLCNTSTGKVYFISSNSLDTGYIENQIYYLTGNDISGGLTLYNNTNFRNLNANQDVYSIGTSFTSGQYITCINHYTNGVQISVYSDGNSGSS